MSLWLLACWIADLNPAGACMSLVSVVCSGRGLCDRPITRPRETYQVWCVWVWSPNLNYEEGCHAIKKNGKLMEIGQEFFVEVHYCNAPPVNQTSVFRLFLAPCSNFITSKETTQWFQFSFYKLSVWQTQMITSLACSDIGQPWCGLYLKGVLPFLNLIDCLVNECYIKSFSLHFEVIKFHFLALHPRILSKLLLSAI